MQQPLNLYSKIDIFILIENILTNTTEIINMYNKSAGDCTPPIYEKK